MLLSVAVVVGVILVVLLGMDLWQKKKMWKARTIPGPPALPIIGNLLLFAHCRGVPDLMVALLSVAKDYQYFVKLWLFNTLVVFVAEPRSIENALMQVNALKKPFYYSFFKNFTGGMFTEEGAPWQALRRMITTSLYKKDLVVFLDLIKRKSAALVDRLNEQTNEFFDPSHAMGNCIFDMSLGNFYGVESNRLRNSDTGILHQLLGILNSIVVRVYRPWLHYDFIYTKSSAYRECSALLEPIKKVLLKAVLRRKELTKGQELADDVDSNSPKTKTVYLDRISKWNNENGLNDPAEDMNKTLDIVLAGMDTTLHTLCSALYYLSHHPEWQEKLYEEYCDVLGGGRVTAETVNKLPLTDMVINDVLRLHSPPLIGRVTTVDLDLGEHTVPKGANMILCSYGVHRNPEYWEKPNEFYPEHFSPEAVARRPKMCFIPFGLGTRKCPGNVYSNWVTKTVLSDIIMNFRVETDMPTNLKIKALIMILLDHRYSFRFIPREKC